MTKTLTASTASFLGELLRGADALSTTERVVLVELLGEGLPVASADWSATPVTLVAPRYRRAFEGVTAWLLPHLIGSSYSFGLYPLGLDGAQRYAVRPRS